jgi:hypothetical protein
MEGFISIHRRLLEWEWWEDHNTTRLFIYLLLKANFQDKKWQGIDIKRGQILTSYDRLIKETGLTIRQIRTSITKLKTTSSLTVIATSKYTIITICKYDSYQIIKNTSDKQNDKQNDKRETNQRQTNVKPTSITNNENNNNKENNVNNHPPNPQKNDDVEIQFFGSKKQYDFSKIKWNLWNHESSDFILSVKAAIGEGARAKLFDDKINDLITQGYKATDPKKVFLPILIQHLKDHDKW